MLNPYLNFPGTAEKAFNFYKSIFGGEFVNLSRFKDMTDMPPITAAEQNMILHVGLPIGQNTLMGSDILPSLGHAYEPGNNCSLSFEVGSKHEADRIFMALSEGGVIKMPLQDTFWGDYFGMVTDKFNIHWMISYPNPQN